MARLAVLAAVLGASAPLAGCAQMFGLDETTAGAGPTSLTIQRASVGARIAYAPQDFTNLTATFLVPDEAEPTGLRRVPAMRGEAGTWVAPFNTPAAVLFDLPDNTPPIPRLFDFPQTAVKTLHAVLEHPSPQPAPDGATLTLGVTLDAIYTGAERFELFTLGSWNAVALAPPAVNTAGPLAQTIQFASLSILSGRTPHEKLTAADAVVVLRYVGNELRGAYRAPGFEQTGTDTIAGEMAAVAIAPFTVGIDQADANRRYGLVRPLVGTPAVSWTLRAAPGAQLNIDQGPLLAAGAPTDMTSITSQAGNPFAPDWASTMLWQTQATRTYTPPSAGLPATLAAGMHERAVLAPGLQMRLPAGIPTRVSLDGVGLESDGAVIARPARGVEVAFMTDVEGASMYQLQLYKLVPNAGNTALVREQKLGAAGAAPRFVLPPELFEAGGLYTLRAITVAGGFPEAASGDLTQRSLPIAVSFLDSGVFQVMP